MKTPNHIPRAIEVGFPIVEINRLAVPERNSFKPIYQMHKWFARRASCVFRAILLGALKPATKPDGMPTDLMEEFYKDHSKDPDTRDVAILDPFMGGGTTVVEALRLGCRVTGIDLNPVAWFVVKTEVEPVDLDKLQEAFERLAARPVAWNGGKPLRETLLSLYKSEVAPGVEADVIYTLWVKHAVCTDPTCGREVPLFDDYLVAHKTPSVRYYPDVTCARCGKPYDWELEPATLIADPALMANAGRGSAGEGRPTQVWTYAPPPASTRDTARHACPHCRAEQTPVMRSTRAARKKVSLSVLLCPACEAVWQWRGQMPEGKVACPACGHSYDPRQGNLPEKGRFLCSCGQKDRIIESIRRLPPDRRLPVRPYALQVYLPTGEEDGDEDDVLFTGIKPEEDTMKSSSGQSAEGLLLPKNGKFFTRFSPSDRARLQQGEALWEKHREKLPYPKSAILRGAETTRLLEHHYSHWHEMFFPRQLLALSALLDGIMAEPDPILHEMLLCAFSDCAGRNNQFCRYFNERNTIQEIFSRHDYQPKVTIAEGSVFGDESVRGTYPQMFGRLKEGKTFNASAFDWTRDEHGKPKEVYKDKLIDGSRASLMCQSSALEVSSGTNEFSGIITDPPYVGNVNYSELADFFHVWLRLALKDRYPWFAPELTPKADEVVENRTRGKSQEDFFNGLAEVFQRVHDKLSDGGLLVFTFHHTDEENLVWEGLLQSLCDTGFEIAAVYPIHGEKESSLHLQDKENISYNLIQVCRKRRSDPETRSWAGIRQEVRRRARAELAAIEAGRYGNEPLSAMDVRLICIGKCLELYSNHYGRVVDHEGNPLRLHEALQDIGAIVDNLVTRERPLPPELEDTDPITYAWLRVLAEVRAEIAVNNLSKALRAMQVTVDNLKDAGLIIKGRTGRGRYYKVKQPTERLNGLKEELGQVVKASVQGALFDDGNRPLHHEVRLVDAVHLLIAAAWAGESVAPWLENFSWLRPKIRAALRHLRERRPDWREPIERVLNLVEGAPLFNRAESQSLPQKRGGKVGGTKSAHPPPAPPLKGGEE